MSAIEMPTPITDEQLRRLRGISSPTIANAIETLDLRDRATGYIGGNVACRFPDLGVMVGRAITAAVTNSPGVRGGGSGFSFLWEVLHAASGPTVIVFADASGEPHRVAFAGEVMVAIAQRLGAVGIVTDGALRDIDEAHTRGFHYFMRYPVVSHAWFDIIDIGQPVTIDGQRIRSGDILHGDVNGIAVIPDGHVDAVIAAADEVALVEQRLMDYVGSAAFDFDTFAANFRYDAD
jgi:4-hydroxy-4-methyl-2-oxoglutarate aldolase